MTPNRPEAGNMQMTDEQIIDMWNRAMGSVFTLESRALAFARALLSASKPAAIDTQEAKPVGWLIDPGAGSATDRFQQVEPYGWQYAEVEKRGGSITPLYSAPLDKGTSKPAACETACPPQTVCDYCAGSDGKDAAPSPAQTERGAFTEWWDCEYGCTFDNIPGAMGGAFREVAQKAWNRRAALQAAPAQSVDWKRLALGADSIEQEQMCGVHMPAVAQMVKDLSFAVEAVMGVTISSDTQAIAILRLLLPLYPFSEPQ